MLERVTVSRWVLSWFPERFQTETGYFDKVFKSAHNAGKSDSFQLGTVVVSRAIPD
jgi:hypothetical protein